MVRIYDDRNKCSYGSHLWWPKQIKKLIGKRTGAYEDARRRFEHRKNRKNDGRGEGATILP